MSKIEPRYAPQESAPPIAFPITVEGKAILPTAQVKKLGVPF